jgi:MoxR-like ATPase
MTTDAPSSSPPARVGDPSFCHHEAIQTGREHLFDIYQLADPEMRRCLFASLLVKNALTLLSGTYGTGKTQFVHLVRTIFFSDGNGQYLADYETCHQDLTAFDVLYHLDLAALQNGQEVVHPKDMVNARLKFFNEIQRAGTSFFNALLPLFAERRVTYRDHVFDVPDHVCIMDRNPQDAASNELPEAFVDRIDFSFDIPAIHLDEMLALHEIRRRDDGYHWGDLGEATQSVVSFHQLEDVWNDVERVDIPRRMLILGGMLTDALRLCIRTERSTTRVDFDLECERCEFYGEICSHLLKIPGQRITNSLFRLAQALAWLDQDSEVSTEHVLSALPWAFSHRLTLRPEHLRETPSVQHWVRHTALANMLRPKLPRWSEALDAYEDGDVENLKRLGKSDLVIREIYAIASENQA